MEKAEGTESVRRTRWEADLDIVIEDAAKRLVHELILSERFVVERV